MRLGVKNVGNRKGKGRDLADKMERFKKVRFRSVVMLVDRYGSCTQLDFVLCKTGNLKEIEYCKVVPGESLWVEVKSYQRNGIVQLKW